MRTRQHVNPLGLSFATFTGQKPRLVAGRPVELEIGCADAQFLFERAQVDPERTYLGMEVRDLLVDHVNERAAAESAPVQAIFCNANHHLAHLLAPGSVARVYLNFPDPWFKRRHRKRRMIDADLARQIHTVLEAAGEVFIQSDVWDVALDALDVFERQGERFVNLGGEWSFWKRGNPFGARSWREEHCEAGGMPIWRIYYRRR